MQAKRRVSEQLDEHSTAAADDDRAEGRILNGTDQHLDAARHHALHDHAGHLAAELRLELPRDGANRGRVGQVQANSMTLGLVQQRRTRRLEDDGIAHAIGFGYSLVGVRDEARRRGVDSRCGEQAPHVLRRQPPPAARQHFVDERAEIVGAHVGERGNLADGLCAPFSVVRDARERAGGGLRKGVARDRREGDWSAVGAHENAEDRLALRLGRDRGDGRCHGIRFGHQRRNKNREHAVDLLVAEMIDRARAK